MYADRIIGPKTADIEIMRNNLHIEENNSQKPEKQGVKNKGNDGVWGVKTKRPFCIMMVI